MHVPPATPCPRCGSTAEDGRVDGLCVRCLGALNFAADTLVEGAEPQPPPPVLTVEELGPLFPQLEIIECLGRGGMGVVYRARQRSLGRMVALKLLAPERAADPKFAGRFAREARALAALSHPNIVGIHDFGEAGGHYFLIMEFVDGVNLRQLLRTRRLTPEEALSIVPPVCAALQCAHSHGIVHRDIKPENLLMDRAGTVKIADFGIAGMVKAGAGDDGEAADSTGGATLPMGTPDYAAPEQRSGHADHRADIYSLGVVLYELLTGERPAPRLEPPSQRVQLDIRLDQVVLRALEQSPERRYATASEFATALEQATQPLVKRAPRRVFLRTAAGVALAGGAVAAGWGYWRRPGEEPEFTAFIEPVEISENAVIVKLTTSQPRPPCELRIILSASSAAGVPAMPESLRRRPDLLDFTVYPRASNSYQPWTDFGSARELTIAFVLPSQELAQAAMAQLQQQPVRHTVRIGRPGSDRVSEPVLFACGDHRAVLRFTPPMNQDHPRWMAIKQTRIVESAGRLRLEWEVRASRPGLVTIRRGAERIEFPLTDSDGGSPAVYRAPLSVEIGGDASSNAAVCGVGGQHIRVPLPEGTPDLLSRVRQSALANYLKTERGWEADLAAVAGEPFVLTLTDDPP